MTDEPVTESRVEAARKALSAVCRECDGDEEQDRRIAEFEQAVSEKARDEERRALREAAGAINNITVKWVGDIRFSRGHPSLCWDGDYDGLSLNDWETFNTDIDRLRARLAASPTEEVNRG